jgi:serine phosphatase RsbU (regulator of sigma subunit)
MQKLEDTGIHGENIRIISSDTAGNVSYDTGIHLNEAALRFAALLKDPGYMENRKKFFSNPEDGNPDSADYLIDSRSISSSMRTVYKNPSTWERLKSVITESEKNGYRWKEFIEADIVYSGRISEVVVSLKARASELDNKKAGYLNDAVYRGLYKKYQMILDERDKSYAALNPYRDYEKKMNKLYLDDLAAVDRRVNEITSSISVLKLNQKKYTDRSDDIQIEIDDQTERLAQMKSDAADLKNDYIRRSEQLSLSAELLAADSFRYLRDAALYDYMQIKYGSGAGSLREYMSSSGVRARHRARWRTVRNWVVSGSGETGFPQFVSGYKRVQTIDNGVLAFGRSEVESYMWFLDSTPIASEVTLTGFSPGEDSLSAYLQRELVTGYNEVLIDKSEGIKRVERNTAMLLYYSVFLAVLSVALTYFFAGIMVKRIRGIIAEAKRVRGGQLDVVFPQKGMDEIEDLGASLNAMMTGLREKEQLKSELYAAGELQKQLLPDKLPSNLDRFYTIGSYYMAMQGVGGDYYDFIELDADRLFFCIGDVSNHGVGPAIVMSMLRAHLHGIINRGKCDIKEIMLELNAMIYYDTPHHIFVTFFSGIIDKTDNTIVYGSAGHPRSIVYRYKSSSIEVLDGGGLPLGMDDNDFFEDTIAIQKIKLMPGDLFFQYTDGLTESMNDAREQFGDDRLHNLISENSKKKIDILIKNISESVNLFSGVDPEDSDGKKPGDDMAMIAVKRIK